MSARDYRHPADHGRAARDDRLRYFADGEQDDQAGRSLRARALAMLMDAGAKPYPCKMSCDLFELKKDDSFVGVCDILSASDFFELTPGAQVIFI